MKMERFFTHPLGVITAATGSTLLWGSAFPFIKLSYAQLHIEKNELFEQLLFAGYRFVLAAVLIFFFMSFLQNPIKYQRGTVGSITKVSFFQTFSQYVFFYIGLSYSTGIQGSIIAGTTSFFQILMAHFMFKNDSLTWRKIIGLIIGFCGVLIVLLPQGSFSWHFGIGELFLLVAMFSGGLGNLLAKKESAQLNVMYLTAYQMLLGGGVLMLIGVAKVGWFPFHFQLQSGLMLLYLAFLSAAGFMLWNTVMKYNSVGKVSMYMFLIPVFGVLLSSLMLREAIHATVLLSLIFVASGIIIVHKGKEKMIQKLIGVKKSEI